MNNTSQHVTLGGPGPRSMPYQFDTVVSWESGQKAQTVIQVALDVYRMAANSDPAPTLVPRS